jgi:hypothetical protein
MAMRGYELLHARQRLREILRRSASLEGFTTGAFLALDHQELVMRADPGDQSTQGHAVKQRLILLGLSQMHVAPATVATAWHLDEAALAAVASIPLLDRSGRADAIEQQVLDELPETPPSGVGARSPRGAHRHGAWDAPVRAGRRAGDLG